MDTEDLAKVSLDAIDDWPDEEIIGFKPEEGWFYYFSSSSLGSLVYCCWKPIRKPSQTAYGL